MSAIEEAARAVMAMHRYDPYGGMGYLEDGEYGRIDPACLVCGTTDEYAVPWPCSTYATLAAVLEPETVA